MGKTPQNTDEAFVRPSFAPEKLSYGDKRQEKKKRSKVAEARIS